MIFYHWQSNSYIKDNDFPVFLSYVAPGEHPELEFHDHNTSELVFVLSGEADYIVQNDHTSTEVSCQNLTCHIQEGDVLVIHPGSVHAYDHTENLEIFNLVYDYNKLAIPLLDGYAMPLFHVIFPRENSRSLEKRVLPILKLNKSELILIESMLNEMQLAVTERRPGVFFEVLGLFMRIVTLLGRMRLDEKNTHRQSRYSIANALLLMTKKYASHISLDELAKSVNMSRRNFCRQFQQVTGTTPMQYLLRLRINHAIELLQDSDMDIGEIAMQCGFCDSNYFCKQFRKICHKSPGAFRREICL